jgi:peptidoglycan/xylan/chitin deacetylase (PgdA/CDA1 family)
MTAIVPDHAAAASPGVFVLSLDTELAWGSFDEGGIEKYSRHLGQYRSLIRQLIALLDTYQVPTTWAFVGHLLLDGCERAANGETHPEVLRPRYAWYPHDWHHLDPATDINRDPWWYAPDVLKAVLSAKVQHEIATHTFTHIVVDDPACTAEIFRSQLAACASAHRRHGLEIHSLVFPRNRVAHREVMAELGIMAYRGREQRWYTRLWPETSGSGLLHILDRASFIPPTTYPLRQLDEGSLVNVPASMLFLSRDGFRRHIPLRARTSQAKAGLRKAAEHGELFHLWFHPVNMASDPALFPCLEEVLRFACELREKGRLECLTMHQTAERVRRDVRNATNRCAR